MSLCAASCTAQLQMAPQGVRQNGDVASVPPPSIPAHAVLLDQVVAVINTDVILGSDVLEEERFMQLQPFPGEESGTEAQEALAHLIDRRLILQQMKELSTPPKITEAAVDGQIADLRKRLPACGQDKCATDTGWAAVLATEGFTPEEFRERWRERMLVLDFIEVRFRAGVRVSKPEIQDYYQKTLVVSFRKRNLPPPPLATVSARIEEILLQGRVNGLLAEWLNSLKQEGSVSILDPDYKELAARDNPEGGSDDGNVEGAQE